MTLYFQTNTELDLRALTTIGVSVKGPNSIGFFGSGFKYSLAVLLRKGHEIWVQELFKKRVHFSFQEVIIRDKQFNIVTCDGQELGFTTDMGPRWEVWMALRELIANTRDEGGVYGTEQQPGYRYTIAVSGDGIMKAWKDVDTIFINPLRKPIASDDYIEIYENFSPYVFYKGMRAGLQSPASVFTYNVLMDCNLTEERTIQNSPIPISHGLRSILFQTPNEALISRTLTSPKGSLEHGVDFDYKWIQKSTLFLNTAKSLLGNASLNSSILRLFQDELEISNVYSPSKMELQLLETAWQTLNFMGYEKIPLNFIRSKSADLLGRCFDGKIYISDLAFRDLQTLVGTIYEELVHKHTGLKDYTTEFQNYLVDEIVKYAMIAKEKAA